jgi:hypothetical protein
MIRLLCFGRLASRFKSKLPLEAENAVLRHQLNVLRRRLRGRVGLTNSDRWFFIQLYRWFPSILQVLTIIRPETLVRWHRAGFRCYSSGVDVLVCGHSHRPRIETIRGVLQLSPGSARPRRFNLPVTVATLDLTASGLIIWCCKLTGVATRASNKASNTKIGRASKAH